MGFDYKDLRVWQDAMALAEQAYVYTQNLPSCEKFGLTSQIQRAAVSVPSNIAEGSARGTTKDYIRFLVIARGSLAELETQLLLCGRMKFGSIEKILETLVVTRKQIQALINSLRKRMLY